MKDNGGYPVQGQNETDEEFTERFETFTDRAAWYDMDH